LYRQKYCVNNGENLGFAKPGHEGFYNLAMMSDKRSVLGVGAGATGKIYDVHANRCHRMETVKNVAMYIDRVDQIGQQKIANLWLTQNT
jgi:oxygen-independent coproporphyrinogen-3 oxidase